MPNTMAYLEAQKDSTSGIDARHSMIPPFPIEDDMASLSIAECLPEKAI